MLDLSLLRDRRFDMIAALSLLIMLAYLVPFAFSSVRAEQLGIDETKASFLIFILGKQLPSIIGAKTNKFTVLCDALEQ